MKTTLNSPWTQKKPTVSYRVHFLFDEPGEELGTKRRRDGSSRQGALRSSAHSIGTQHFVSSARSRQPRPPRLPRRRRVFPEKARRAPRNRPQARHGRLGTKPVTVVSVVSVVPLSHSSWRVAKSSGNQAPKPRFPSPLAPQARHGCLGGPGCLALPLILERGQIQWQLSHRIAFKDEGAGLRTGSPRGLRARC